VIFNYCLIIIYGEFLKILYSYNKHGAEAEFWQREIANASSETIQFIPFNHGQYINSFRYLRAQMLDNLYYVRDPELISLYSDLERCLHEEQIDALIVDNCPPYHPDWLRNLPIFKALRIADGPISAYDRDFAYAHAYDLILYHSPAYSCDMGMKEKLEYIGARKSVFWPHGVFDAAFDPDLPEKSLIDCDRDLDVVFVGALHREKMPFLAQVKRALGKRCRIHGLASHKQNIFFNARYGFPGWVTSIQQSEYIPLYQRAKIGFNIHNRGKYTVGSYRLFELAANGVMQISDGDDYLNNFFEVDKEIVNYRNFDDLIDKINYFLFNDFERKRIATSAYRRVMRDYRMKDLLHKAALIIYNINK
jgi:glycosyltransferase involved in cell wall biosynthesis